jgi:hypothetical protein
MTTTGVAREASYRPAETPGALSRLRDVVTGLRPAWKALGAYLIYQVLAFAIWVVPILPVFGREHIGTGLQDSRYYQWALEWTPWAISHGIDPLHAGYVFAPTGVSLSWSAFVPGPALLAWPVTALFGPLVSLNVLLAVAPALAAWGAYLVCNRLTHRFWPSLLGGCLFGFSAYMSSNMNGWLNLVLIFPVPLLVYLVIRRVEGSLGPVAFVAGFAALLIGLFSISTELFGTAALFGAVAFLGAIAFATELRARLVRTGGLVLLAGAIAALVLLPYIVAIFADAPDQPVRQAEAASPDLTSLVVPPPVIRAGGPASEATLKGLLEFPRSNGQSYIGGAVIVMLLGFAITERRRRTTWLLLGFVVVSAILTLGPVLHIAGHPSWPLPERAVTVLPLMAAAVPARLALYSALAIGIVAAMWLSSSPRRSAWIRWFVVGAALVSLFPYAPHHADPVYVPSFFSTGATAQVLRPGENVYVIPSNKGEEMLWQAASGFWFKLAQGYIGPIPPELDSGQMALGLHLRKVPVVPTPEEFASWTRQRNVSAVILDDRASQKYGHLLLSAGLDSVFVGDGVSVWRWPTDVTTPGT